MAITNKKDGGVLLVKGLDVSKPAEYITEQNCSQCQNVEVVESLIKKRAGSTVIDEVIGGTGIEIMAGRQFSRQGVSYNVRYGLDKTEVYDAVNEEWDNITYQAVATDTDWTGDTDDIFDTSIVLLSGAEIIVAANGKDVMQKWTGSGLSTVLGGSPPVPKYIQEYKTYLVAANIAGGVDVDQRVQWSDTADPENWSTGNAGSVDLIEDGEGITGINLYGNYLCVHKPSSISLGFLVSSSSIFQFDRRATGAGTVANNSIVNLPSGEQVFLSKDGIRLFNGITAPLIPSPINDEIRSSLNTEKAHKAYGLLVKEKDEVWIGVPIGSQEYGETIYKYNYITGALHKDFRDSASIMWRGSSTNTFAWNDFDDTITWDDVQERWDDVAWSTDSEQINIGRTDGFVYKVDKTVFTDNGTVIDAFWDSKDFQISQDMIGRWKRMELWATGSDVNVYYSIDAGDNWTEISNSPLTLASTMPTYESPLILYFDLIASTIRFRFKNITNNLAIKQFIMEYVSRENRR